MRPLPEARTVIGDRSDRGASLGLDDQPVDGSHWSSRTKRPDNPCEPTYRRHARLRKIFKTRGDFPSNETASKLIRLALRNITANCGR